MEKYVRESMITIAGYCVGYWVREFRNLRGKDGNILIVVLKVNEYIGYSKYMIHCRKRVYRDAIMDETSKDERYVDSFEFEGTEEQSIAAARYLMFCACQGSEDHTVWSSTAEHLIQSDKPDEIVSAFNNDVEEEI